MCGKTFVSEAAANTVRRGGCLCALPAKATAARTEEATARAAARPPRARAVSRLHHHGGRLDDGRCGHPGLGPSSSTASRVTIGDDAGRLGHGQFHLREQAFDPHLADRAAQPIARAHLWPAAPRSRSISLQRHEPPVRAVAFRADPSLAIPAAQRVDADPSSRAAWVAVSLLARAEYTYRYA